MSRRLGLLLLVVTLAGCGTSGDGRPDAEATLTLDAPPGAADAGIQLAVDRGYTEAEGVDLDIEVARPGTSGAAELSRSATDFAVVDAAAATSDQQLVAVMALTQPRGGAAARLLVTTRDIIDEQPDLVAATVHALQRGYRETIADPESAVSSLFDADRKAGERGDRAGLQRDLQALSPAFQASDGTIGTLDAIKDLPRAEPRFARSGAKQTAQEDG